MFVGKQDGRRTHITTRIYVLHKITIALKFMSYINSDLPILAKKLQTPGQPQCTKWINGLDWKRVGSQQCDELDQFKSNQEHIATHIFSDFVIYVDFLQLQGYISIQQASGLCSNFSRISFQKFMWLAQLQLIVYCISRVPRQLLSQYLP